MKRTSVARETGRETGQCREESQGEYVPATAKKGVIFVSKVCTCCRSSARAGWQFCGRKATVSVHCPLTVHCPLQSCPLKPLTVPLSTVSKNPSLYCSCFFWRVGIAIFAYRLYFICLIATSLVQCPYDLQYAYSTQKRKTVREK